MKEEQLEEVEEGRKRRRMVGRGGVST